MQYREGDGCYSVLLSWRNSAVEIMKKIHLIALIGSI